MYISGQILPERLAALLQTALFTEGASASGDKLLEIILRSVMQAADSTAASLFLVEKDMRNAQTTAFIYDDVFHCLDTPRPLPAAAAWVIDQNEPLRIDNPNTGTSFTSNGLEGTPYDGAEFIAAPLSVGTSCFGVLGAIGKRGGCSFSEADLSLLGLAAGYAASVYRTAYAYQCYRVSAAYAEEHTVTLSEEPFIAASSVMREKLELCKHLASSDVPVLIIGEAGVGKASLAKQLHLQSSRAGYPFIRVSCAELQNEPFETRLFGLTADNTADSNGGYFEQATDGTLFLDEATAIPLYLQKKLLNRLLALEKTGARIRLIASTTRDIERLAKEGDFLSELYGKLNVLPLYIPPLRQRREDIAALARFFLRRYARKLRKRFTDFSQDAEAALQNAEWKGNIPELKNTVEYGCLNGHRQLITAGDLFPRHTVMDSDKSEGLKSAVNAFKRAYITAALEKNGGNQTATASVLKIQRTYLSHLMKELKIRNTNN